MKYMRTNLAKIQLALFLLFIVCFDNLKCDIPVHCLKSQVKSLIDKR